MPWNIQGVSNVDGHIVSSNKTVGYLVQKNDYKEDRFRNVSDSEEESEDFDHETIAMKSYLGDSDTEYFNLFSMGLDRDEAE